MARGLLRHVPTTNADGSTRCQKGVLVMAGKTDKVKGRVKEAAGALTHKRSLKRQGKIDQAVGTVKDVFESAVDSVRDAFSGHK